MKRIIALLLVMVMSIGMTEAALADKMLKEGRSVQYGDIRVLVSETKTVCTYSAARDDENGIVYIRAEDFASIVGGTLNQYGKGEDCMLNYAVGNWRLSIQTDEGIGWVSYNFDNNDDDVGYSIYEPFRMTDCLLNEAEGSWYLPFEEMMYMCALQWGCQEDTVLIYQQETLFDIIAECEEWLDHVPAYEELMGEGFWSQMLSSFKYGVMASLDEIDMGFLWTGGGNYTEKTIMNALMMTLVDTTLDGDQVSSAMSNMSDFVGAAATVLDLTDEGVALKASHELLENMLGWDLDADLIPQMSKLAAPGVPLITYALSVGQVMWTRDMLSENLEDRIAYIEKKADARVKEDDYYKDLKKAAQETKKRYFGSEAQVYFENLSLDSIMTLVDGSIGLAGTTQDEVIGTVADRLASKVSAGAGAVIAAGGDLLGFGLGILSTMNLTVGVFDLAMEVIKTSFPEAGKVFEDAENAHVCLYLVRLADMMKSEFEEAMWTIKYQAHGQDVLDEARMSALVMMNASLHSHEILKKLEKWTMPDAGYEEPQFAARLIESSRYDRLLQMDSGFADIVSNEPGSIRHDIPVEYVRLDAPVVVTTETYIDSGEHFSARITRPHVYAEANPELTAIIDAELDKLYQKKMASLEDRKANAASCKSNMQTHTETLTLTSAYSSGGFVTFSLQSGYFMCGVGHDCNETFTYIFDIASGELLEFKNLLDLENNPDAEQEFKELLATVLEEEGRSSSKAEKLYSEMFKDEYARWDISPKGIKILADLLYFNGSVPGITYIPYERLSGILKEEYLPKKTSGQMQVTIAEYDAAAIDEDDLVYENTPSAGMMTLMGSADHIWVGNAKGLDGRCEYFYAYAPGSSTVTLPVSSTSVAWIDGEGEHAESLKPPK